MMDMMQRYTLSNAPELGPDACWGDVMDPKEKKRMQNRIAQRTYRQRMKARLEKLQAKVNYHEQMSTEIGDKDKNMPNRHHDQHMSNQEQTSLVTLESLTPNSPEQQPPQPQVIQTSYCDQPIEKGSKPLYMQPSLIDTAQQLPQARHMLPEQGDQTVKTTERISPEHTQLPKQQAADKHPTPPLRHISPQEENARMVDNSQLFTPEVNDVMEFNSTFDMWTSEMLAQMRRQQQPQLQTQPQTQPQQQQQQPELTSELLLSSAGDDDKGTAPADSSMTGLSLSPVPSAEQGLDERFEYVLACTRAAGFESFDALVTAYYNGNFDDSSPLAIEQRLSRNRGLPSVVADIFRDARCWSDWERRGFDEELLKTTETMLVSEGEENHSLEGILRHLSEPRDEKSSPSSKHVVLEIKKAIQNELPNLWALMMALSTEQRDIWQRNRSNTVLAAILLLRYPGRIPKQELLKLVSGAASG